jgi:predicted TIM-barrel fold metal-dependent hydrolase
VANGIIDADFHPTIANIRSVLTEHLSRTQMTRLDWIGAADGLFGSAYRMPGRPHHFTDASRADLLPPSGGPIASDVDFIRATYLQPQNIDTAILIPLDSALVDRWTYTEESAWFVSAVNDHLLEHWVGEEPRFRLDMVVTPLAIDLAVAEIHRIGANPGVSAIYLPMQNTLFGDRRFFPIWEAACEYDLPIMVHPMSADAIVGGPVRAGGTTKHHAENYVTLCEFAMSHMASMIFDGVFERYPRLKFVFVEFGWSWLPSLLWRMDATWKAARHHHPFMRKSPSDYVRDHIRFTSQPALEVPNEHMKTVLKMMNAEHLLLFSSDYPHWDSEAPWLPFKNIDEHTRQRIFHDNAAEFFGPRIPAPAAVA